MGYTESDVKQTIEKRDNAKLMAIMEGRPDLIHGNYLADIDEPLHNCAAYGTVEMCEYLLSLGIDVNNTVEGHSTPLSFAARENQIAIAKFLLSNGAYVDALNTALLTPMMSAITFGHLEMVKLLVENGANLNRMHVRNGMLPLDIAISRKREAIVSYLKAKGAETQYVLPEWAENDSKGSGILSYVTLTLGKILPVNINETVDNTPVVQKLVSDNGHKNRILFTFGLFELHQPKIELFIFLQEYWNFYVQTYENQFPILLLSRLVGLIKHGRKIKEGNYILANDPQFDDLKWPTDIAGMFVSDVHWKSENEPIAVNNSHDEVVNLYTLIPIKKTKKTIQHQSIEKARSASWSKLTLKLE